MNEMQAILKAFAEGQRKGETAFLATVVKTKGSTYRRPGAKMLMTSKGKIVGAISGGCLENDVFEHTRQKMPQGEPIVVTYDTTVNDDILWGFGLGCNGIMEVLIERLDFDSYLNPIAFIAECYSNQQSGAIATVIAVDGAINLKLGSRLMLPPDGSVTTNIEKPNFTKLLLKDIRGVLSKQQSTIKQYEFPLGSAEVLIEVIQPPITLVIFGAGSDAIPVATFAKTLGWYVTVVDCRASETTKKRFEMVDKVILTHRDIVHQQIYIDQKTVAVVMNHNYPDDLAIMKMLMPSSAPYLGCLGPKHRTEKLLEDLHTDDIVYTRNQLEKLHAPIGIDIGAETPEEIALAIIAEIKAVIAKHPGGFLKDRKAPIHQKYERQESQRDVFDKLMVVRVGSRE
jgi:xanthine dehydrogenase accessory factor